VETSDAFDEGSCEGAGEGVVGAADGFVSVAGGAVFAGGGVLLLVVEPTALAAVGLVAPLFIWGVPDFTDGF